MTGNLILESPNKPDTTYEITSEVTEGEVYRIYGATMRQPGKADDVVIVKVALGVDVNDLAEREARTLQHINGQIGNLKLGNRLLIPELRDSFKYHDKQITVTDCASGYFTLTQIRERYPQGVPPEHASWMFNRMLVALMLTHNCGVIHGALLPPHFMIRSGTKNDPVRHTGVLLDWTNAILEERTNQWSKLSSMSGVDEYECYYPREVFLRQPATPQTDLAMAAACTIYLLGGDVKKNTVPESTPWGFAQMLHACRKENPAERPRNISEFYDQLQRVYRSAFGPPQFRELPL